MNWSTSVLTTLSSDTEPTIIVTFDSAKYIFNAGENTNRAFLQSRGNWKRTRGLFFTDIDTKRASGLPGLLMSFADATIPRLNIAGPPGLLHFMSGMRLYTYRDTLTVNPIESSWTPSLSPSPDPLYRDENISVYGIPITPSSPISTHETCSAEANEVGQKRKRDPSPHRPEKRPTLTTDTPSPSLETIRHLPEFAPQSLEGEAAQEWRRLMINTMFPGTKVKPERVPRDRDAPKRRAIKRAKQKADAPIIENDKTWTTAATNDTAAAEGASSVEASAEVVANIDPYRRARLPVGFHSQLPKFTPHVPAAPLDSPAKPTMAYIVVGPRIRGKFDVQSANALGVPSGPLRGQLAKGNTVKFNVKVDGEFVERTVRPEEVLGESEAPGALLILDIPTTMHIPALLSSFEGSPFYAKFRSQRPEANNEYSVRSVFHLCGKGVLEDERYIAFMDGFAPNVHHLIASREHSPDPVTFTSAAFNQLRMNQLDPEIFPLPKFSLSAKKSLESIPNLPATTRLLESSQLLNMRTGAPPVRQETHDSFHSTIASEKPPALPAKTAEKFADAKKSVEEHIASGKLHVPRGADVKIIPLGTGSAVPSKYRNVSSTLVQIPNWGNILLDAGEGTWGQLTRQFGLDDDKPNNVWDMLRDLKCIYVSHIHGDHHMGLAQILAKRRSLDPPPSFPLYLVSIRAVHLYIRELSDLQDLGLDDPSGNGVVPIMAESLHWREGGGYQTHGMWQVGGTEPWTDFETSQRNAENMRRDLGLEKFSTVDVLHRTRCYGAVIKHKDGWSVVFSGDTQPANSLVWAGKESTLLIHEATMADDQTEMAAQKAHSTFGQAVNVGKRMNAEHILLTHFSARYPKMPPSAIARPSQIPVEDGRAKEPIVALAFDHANLAIGNMWKVNYYLPALEQSFRDTVAEEGDDPEEMEVEPEGMDVALD
ncbi:putative tRNase Z endonuclease [Lyophyllum shimeji]|uniref:ribonuclease Z n=1 Tax=Lyophyllum shimeji TaxID=47721 RepID=A0A9P3PUL0_LYOSH|nr:putative tRNase Z endonuclease [Lyophyllum shimeji]